MNRRWIEILTSNKDGQIYSVMAWTPLKPGGKGVSAIARRGASVLPKLDETDLGAFNIPHVRVPVVFLNVGEKFKSHSHTTNRYPRIQKTDLCFGVERRLIVTCSRRKTMTRRRRTRWILKNTLRISFVECLT